MELADAGVFSMETRGLKKDSIGGETRYFIKFLEVFCDWAFQPIWTESILLELLGDFPEVCVEFSEKRQSIIRKFVFARSQTLFSFAPSRIDSGLRARQCYLKGQSNEAFVHV